MIHCTRQTHRSDRRLPIPFPVPNRRIGSTLPIVFVILLLLTALMAAMLQQALRMTREANQEFEETQIEWLADAAAAVERSAAGRAVGETTTQEFPAGTVFGRHAVRVSSTGREDDRTVIEVETVAEGPLRIHAIREISTANSGDQNASKE